MFMQNKMFDLFLLDSISDFKDISKTDQEYVIKKKHNTDINVSFSWYTMFEYS